jgi:transcriptional regulator of arginine metabolism
MASRVASIGERQAAIREILAEEPVRSQSELLRRLRRRGVLATQPSVSRDLLEMRVAKVEGRYVLADALARPASAPAPHRPARTAEGLAEGLFEVLGLLRGVVAAGPNILVVQTPPGSANAVAEAIDRVRWPEVVGTLAGDNTLLVLTRSRRYQQRVEARLEELLKEKA